MGLIINSLFEYRVVVPDPLLHVLPDSHEDLDQGLEDVAHVLVLQHGLNALAVVQAHEPEERLFVLAFMYE